MKTFFSISLCLVLLSACSPKEKTSSSSDSTGTTSSPAETSGATKTFSPKVDTILVADGKLYVTVLKYYSIDRDKFLIDFEVREMATHRSVFRSNSSRFVWEDHDSHGGTDGILITPVYHIVTKNPFVVALTFKFDGDFSVGYLENLIGKVSYDTTHSFGGLLQMHFDFLKYKFVNDSSWKINSSLQFVPKKCEFSCETLLNNFSKFKTNPKVDNGTGLARFAFVCFLNGENPQFKSMMVEFRKTIELPDFRESLGAGINDSYPYVEYLDRFIINLNSQ